MSTQKKLLVALHTFSEEQIFTEAEKILVSGMADGVILVNNGGHMSARSADYPNIFDWTLTLKQKYPEYVVGLNPLGTSLHEAFSQAVSLNKCARSKGLMPIDAVWHDKSVVQEGETRAYIDSSLSELISQMLPTQCYGSIAFKYQPQPKNLQWVAKAAARSLSVIVTSGEGTGVPASVSKIKQIREYIGQAKLCLASGVTSKNIDQYLPYVDEFIVGTSLQQDPHNMFTYDPEKVLELSQKIRSILV